MSAFQVIQQRPVMVEKRLGSIPKDAYVLNQGSQPNLAPAAEKVEGSELFEVKDGYDVMAQAPARNEDGSLKIANENVTLSEEPYSDKKFGAIGAGAAAVAGALAGGATGGIYGAIAGGVLSALGGGALGVLNARKDEVSVITREANVTEPVLTGYRSGSIDGAYAPSKPGHWFSDSGGRYHFAIPTLEHRPVGVLQFHEVAHSAEGELKVGATTAGLGAAVGLLAGIAARALGA